MSRNNLLILILFSVLAIIVFIIFRNEFFSFFNWLDLVYAAFFAIVAGFIINYLHRKYSQKSKYSKTTMVQKPRKLLVKLVLPDNKELKINEYQRIFGREDFVGSIVVDDLLFLGKQHFRLTFMDDGFYIQDLDTKNGTIVNGEEIKGMGKIKLRDKDEIILAKVFKIRYLENESPIKIFLG